jgi:hypothetical protein
MVYEGASRIYDGSSAFGDDDPCRRSAYRERMAGDRHRGEEIDEEGLLQVDGSC